MPLILKHSSLLESPSIYSLSSIRSMDGCEADITSHPNEEEMVHISLLSSGLGIDVELECQSVKVSAADLNAIDIDGEQVCQSSKGSSVDKNGMNMDGEQQWQSPDFSSVDKYVIDADDKHKGHNLKVSSMDNPRIDVDSKQECQSLDDTLVGTPGSGHFSGKDEADRYVVPELGMVFESEDHAYECYNRYAALEGFSIRKDFVNKSRVNGFVVSRRYTCYKQGYRSTKHDSHVKKPRKDTRTGCLAHMTIARQANGKYRVTHFETEHNHEFATPFTANMLPSQRRITFAQAVEAELDNNCVIEGVPKLGMGFDSEDHAYEFYNAYAGRVGFSVRKDYVNRSKVDGAVASRRFTCFREGFRQKHKRDLNVKRPRKETRIGCLAQLVIARQPGGRYRVTHFEQKHNHELEPPCRIRMLRSQKRSASEATATDDSGMQPKSASDLISKPVGDGESVGYRPIDYESNLPARRMRDMKQGESESILQYFQNKQLKNPSFFYAVQLDAEGKMTNVFWSDAKMLVDYGDFGDVVCFDMTYKLNKDCRPFAPFIGVNHHKQMVIFGAALLYDDTVESFRWLFRTFLEMSKKKPKTILTDRDAVMAEAINSVLPEAHHRLCAWHVYQNALKHLSQVIVGLDSFSNDLSSCIFNHDEEQDFVDAWKTMLDMYGLWEDKWLDDIFREREKWAIPYGRHIFCADIKSAQLSESFNTTNFRKYLKSDLDVLQFFKHFGRLVNDWRYKELEANYDMSQRMPRLMGDVILLKRVRDVYTPKIFELFQQEYENCLSVVVNQCTENVPLFEYKVSIYRQVREYTVIFNSSEDSVVCSCMKFQADGVLCSHALKVLDYRNIKVVPARYILKRWTKDARCYP
ncbi:protein FAR1-RELATED SEQUENCE 5-like [Camellia sinensis]|uniref:protein FAR1-RELATED SEQUENCE 5-like n=1 Tax=Camellia sinensis TaxID=4442 RepID=UPI0010360063|nr:protein FAR1-RELATED SEQUENCE 5-like [Camellia sinensis]